MHNVPTRKIIHIDMDCFYAAVEIRDNPTLANKPVAIGGSADRRGVLCTCNYIARSFGIHSAMATTTALRLCPQLVLLPVDMPKYRQVSQQIQTIFRQFTDLVEPLSLDEAYLDVTNSQYKNGSATLIAEAIRHEIFYQQQLTSSAGVAPNKFLAKIASSWNKPNGIFVIPPDKSLNFIAKLPVNKLFGVGKVTANKLEQLNIKTCTDLQSYSITELRNWFGKLGIQLYYQVRGIDDRKVEPNRQRKSLSAENTFTPDIADPETALAELHKIYLNVSNRLTQAKLKSTIKSQFVKIKFNDFKLLTAELRSNELNFTQIATLFKSTYAKHSKPIRLLGVGINLSQQQLLSFQPSLF